MKPAKAITTAQASLDQARADLATAQTRKDQIASSESESVASAQSYAAWRADSEAAAVEVTRLAALVVRREAELQAAIDAAAAAEQSRMESEFEQSAKEAAKLIAANLAEMSRLARATVRAIAISEQKREAATVNRSPDLPGLVSAEARARTVPAMPRADISEETVTLWTFASNGSPITSPDQAAEVRPTGGREGRLGDSRVEQRDYKRVKYHPQTSIQFADDLVRQLRIPSVRADGVPGWDNWREVTSPHRLLEEIARLEAAENAGPSRQVCEELIPADEAPAKSLLSKVAGFIRGADDTAATA